MMYCDIHMLSIHVYSRSLSIRPQQGMPQLQRWLRQDPNTSRQDGRHWGNQPEHGVGKWCPMGCQNGVVPQRYIYIHLFVYLFFVADSYEIYECDPEEDRIIRRRGYGFSTVYDSV